MTSTLEWIHDDTVQFDDTIVFGHGYDFFGVNYLRQEAKGPNGNYLLWHRGGASANDRWSLYRDSDGRMAFERYTSEAECKAMAERWCLDIL